jgi:transitional endoplasmic reticulum ATPase
MERERRRSENHEIMEEDEDEVTEITAAHFEESMKYARRTVSDSDIQKYQAFAQTLDQARGFGADEFKFAASGSGAAVGSDPFATTNAGEADEDLYN